MLSIEVSHVKHRGLPRQASKFFRAELALSETTEFGVVAQVVVIKDENPEISRRFKDWLYSKTVISGSETYKAWAWSKLIAMYMFGDRKGISRFQNSCVDPIIRKRNEGGLFPGQADINTLWRTSGRVSRLRRLLLDMFAAKCNLKNALATNNAYYPGFVRGLVNTLYDFKEKRIIHSEEDIWKKRQIYYVNGNDSAIVVDRETLRLVHAHLSNQTPLRILPSTYVF